MSLRKKQNVKKSSPQNVPSTDQKKGSNMPDDSRTRLWELFNMIEKEFDNIHAENTALKEKVDSLSDRLDLITSERTSNLEMTHPPYPHTPSTGTGNTPNLLPPLELPAHHSSTPLRIIRTSGTNITKKLLPKKSATYVKPLTPECSHVFTYYGHRDGVWDVSCAKNGLAILGSASADNTACIWDINNGTVLLKYIGHTGSVNSISFHPSDLLVCTASGDGSAHVWKYSMNIMERHRIRQDSSGDDKPVMSDEEGMDGGSHDNVTIKVPLLSLNEHTGPVMSCDWVCDGEHLVTASWDHSALLWDAQTGTVVHSLDGHDEELTHVCTHPTQKLLVTSSQDTTFRLWDFRAPLIHSVNVFQGHSKAVSSAAFSLKDNVISASDDHTVKIWDLHNMRYPVASIRQDCGVNRISVSHDHHVLAVPLDNRHIKLYDLGGNRLANLPHRNRKEHLRMVHSVCWSHDKHMTTSSPGKCNLFSAGFDSRIIGWKVQY